MIEEAIRKLSLLLQGRIPEKFDPGNIKEENHRILAEKLNQLFEFFEEIDEFLVPLSKGELHDIRIQPRNFLGSPFKELHSRLLHLTWQAERVANGDYSQRIDFMGDFSEAFNAMVVCLEQKETALKNKIEELEKALFFIKKLEGILPICSKCKKIRLEGADPYDQSGWIGIEAFIAERTEASFSHGICPECVKALYPELKNVLKKLPPDHTEGL